MSAYNTVHFILYLRNRRRGKMDYFMQLLYNLLFHLYIFLIVQKGIFYNSSEVIFDLTQVSKYVVRYTVKLSGVNKFSFRANYHVDKYIFCVEISHDS